MRFEKNINNLPAGQDSGNTVVWEQKNPEGQSVQTENLVSLARLIGKSSSITRVGSRRALGAVVT